MPDATDGNPNRPKSNQQINLTNQDAKSLLDDYNADNEPAAETIVARDSNQSRRSVDVWGHSVRNSKLGTLDDSR